MEFVNWKTWIILILISAEFVTCEFISEGELVLKAPKLRPYDIFKGIKTEDKPFLKILKLSDLYLDPNYLLDSLVGCTSLEILTIQNCKWNGNFTRTIPLDNLKEFSIQRASWSFVQSTQKEIMNLLFFNTNPDPMVFNKTGVAVKIEGHHLKIKNRPQCGWQRETIEISKNILRLKFVPFDVTNSFQFEELESIHSFINATSFNGTVVSRLHIQSDQLDTKFLNVLLLRMVDIKELTIENHDTESRRVDLSILPNPSKLEYLKLEHLSYYSGNSWAQFDGLKVVALHHCFLNTHTLQIKSLQNFTISDSPTVFDFGNLKFSSESLQNLLCDKSSLTLLQNLTFSNIKFLKLSDCTLDDKLLNSFSSTFDKVDSIMIQGNVQDLLLSKLLETKVSQVVLVDVEANFGSKLLQILTEANASLPYLGRTIKNAVLKRTNVTWKCTQLILPSWKEYLALFYSITLRSICVLGLVGNALIGIVVCKSMLHSTGVIILGLALCDSVVLLTFFQSLPYFASKLLYIFLKQTTVDTTYPGAAAVLGYFNEKESAETTNFLYALGKTAYSGSVFCTILLIVERFIAVTWPLPVRRLFDRRKATGLVMGTILLAVFLNISRWFEANGFYLKINTSNLRDLEGGVWETLLSFERIYMSEKPLSDIRYRTYYKGWLWTFLMYFLPIPLHCGLNYKIWKKVQYSERANAGLPAASAARGKANLSSVTRMLFTVATVFIACNVARGVIALYYITTGKQDPADIEVIACIPLILNSAVNFIIYFVLGRKFRMEFIKAFKIQGLLVALGSLFSRVPRQESVRLRALGIRRENRPVAN